MGVLVEELGGEGAQDGRAAAAGADLSPEQLTKRLQEVQRAAASSGKAEQLRGLRSGVGARGAEGARAVKWPVWLFR
ncbi:hypothetical protein AB0H94_35910 [Streptomyces purpurascens]|uniref:hypothetical protein n=1 Tax=Streptomyces purpurascens TaxID=1924 RepID=UPI0033C6017D